MMKYAYTVYVHNYGHVLTEENMIVCDESSLVSAINKLVASKENDTKTVCVKRCELMLDPTNTDAYRMGAWGKGKDE